MQPTSQIPSRFDFLLRAFIPRQPAWFRLGNLARLGWRTSRWTPEYLAHRAGSQRVKVLRRRDPLGTYLPENTDYADARFAEFVASVLLSSEGTDESYLNLQNGQIVEAPVLQLLGDFSVPDFYCESPLKSINTWMGNSRKGIVTPLHHDFHDNLYVVVAGRKRFTLYPPDQARNLYPRGDLQRVRESGWIDYRDMKTQSMPHLSRVEPQAPDLKRFPGYREAQRHRLDLELEAGDILFFPAGWFHQVTSLPGRHIAVSFAAQPPADRALVAMRRRLRDPHFIQQMKARYKQAS